MEISYLYVCPLCKTLVGRQFSTLDAKMLSLAYRFFFFPPELEEVGRERAWGVNTFAVA